VIVLINRFTTSHSTYSGHYTSYCIIAFPSGGGSRKEICEGRFTWDQEVLLKWVLYFHCDRRDGGAIYKFFLLLV
jgi:hypothetical protein